MQNPIHEGRNIKRIREIMGIKQEALAIELGSDWTQKKISQLESKESVDQEVLEQVARILKVPADAIRNFNDEAAINIIANTVNNHDQSASVFYNPSFNPIDKIVELYDALVKSEREKVALLERLLNDRK